MRFLYNVVVHCMHIWKVDRIVNMCVVETCTCEKVPHNVHVVYIGYRREHVENLRIVGV